MDYTNISPAVFISRPNRFIARVSTDGRGETVHVKNTGRCRELLVPGCTVYLEKASPEADRKTGYDLVAVFKDSEQRIVNIDSQAPNILVAEWLGEHFHGRYRAEYTRGQSRLDFLLLPDENNGIPSEILMEVKGCTLVEGSNGYFPDAPTERGAKHIRELISAKKEGLGAVLAFVIQAEGVTEVFPNRKTDPAFSEAMDEAEREGVTILFFTCSVKPGSIRITGARAKNRTDISDLFTQTPEDSIK